MEHMHNVIAFLVFFAICGLAAHIAKPAKKSKYGNIKAGDVTTKKVTHD